MSLECVCISSSLVTAPLFGHHADEVRYKLSYANRVRKAALGQGLCGAISRALAARPRCRLARPSDNRWVSVPVPSGGGKPHNDRNTRHVVKMRHP